MYFVFLFIYFLFGTFLLYMVGTLWANPDQRTWLTGKWCCLDLIWHGMCFILSMHHWHKCVASTPLPSLLIIAIDDLFLVTFVWSSSPLTDANHLWLVCLCSCPFCVFHVGMTHVAVHNELWSVCSFFKYCLDMVNLRVVLFLGGC